MNVRNMKLRKGDIIAVRCVVKYDLSENLTARLASGSEYSTGFVIEEEDFERLICRHFKAGEHVACPSRGTKPGIVEFVTSSGEWLVVKLDGDAGGQPLIWPAADCEIVDDDPRDFEEISQIEAPPSAPAVEAA